MAEFVMPSLGADMEAGTLVQWLKKPGDHVARGDIIAVVETQKGAIEIEVFLDGTIESLIAQPGERLPVGAPMAIIRGAGEPAAPAAPAAAKKPAAVAAPVEVKPVAAPIAAPREAGIEHAAPRISPAARKRAAELGADIRAIAGSGPEGAITLADVERAAAAAPSPAAPAAGMRQVIGAAMARSKREIPHYYLGQSVDLEPALAWMEAENAKRPVPERMLYGALLLKAVALTLRDYPELNGFFKGGAFQPSAAIHLGIAISISQVGLIAPAIHDADRLTLAQLMAGLRDLVARARAGGLRSSELSDPTITVTSLGEQGTESVFPVIYPPQVAIVGFGAIAERPWVAEGKVVPRRVISASLAADHRVSDGHSGARFLTAVARRLQEPEKL